MVIYRLTYYEKSLSVINCEIENNGNALDVFCIPFTHLRVRVMQSEGRTFFSYVASIIEISVIYQGSILETLKDVNLPRE